MNREQFDGLLNEHLKALILECLDMRDGSICSVCEERIVELAIRKDYGELYSITLTIITYEPKQQRSYV